jgi:hypothetical protein
LDDRRDDYSLSLREHTMLAKAPKLARRGVAALWNAPNEIIGATYGYLGHAAGHLGHAVAPEKFAKPEIRRNRGRPEFINNPAAMAGAIPIGSSTIYGDDPWSPQGRANWRGLEAEEGHPVWEHEDAHVPQGRQLGPAYLPSNLLGGAASLLLDRHPDTGKPYWHGPHNWNEQGPKQNPPRPWPQKERGQK